MIEHLWFFMLCYLLVGAFAGLMSGLLGVGGGIVIVPSLLWVFYLQHFPEENLIHLAVGTSLSAIAIATLRGLVAYRKYGIQYGEIFKRLLPGIVVGVIVGALVADHLHSNVIEFVFAIFILVIAIQLFSHRNVHAARRLPGKYILFAISIFIGASSGLLGIGGGTFTVPFLHYCNVEIRKAMATSLAVGFAVSIVGTIAFMITGANETALPAHSIGYVYWPAWLGIVIGSYIFVRLGVILAAKLPTEWLKNIFATFLVLVFIDMIIHTRL